MYMSLVTVVNSPPVLALYSVVIVLKISVVVSAIIVVLMCVIMQLVVSAYSE